jgi:parallel beta-helix repeat protein
VRNSDPELVDNTVTNNKDAGIVCCDGGFPVLEGNTVTRNKLAGLKVIGYSEPTVKNNIFEGNHAFGILLLERGRGTFADNTVRGNKCANVCIKARPSSSAQPPVHFHGNKITDGLMWGVHIVEEGSADVSNNVISNNQLPGIESDTKSPVIIRSES